MRRHGRPDGIGHDATEGTGNAGEAEQGETVGEEAGNEAVGEEGEVIGKVCEEAVFLGFAGEGGRGAPCKEDSGEAPGGVLYDGQ